MEGNITRMVGEAITRNITERNADLRAAIIDALEHASHEATCRYRCHFAPLSWMRNTNAHKATSKYWVKWHELKATAPECSCWLGRLAKAAELPIPD